LYFRAFLGAYVLFDCACKTFSWFDLLCLHLIDFGHNDYCRLRIYCSLRDYFFINPLERSRLAVDNDTEK
jgi:hypothetical protein